MGSRLPSRGPPFPPHNLSNLLQVEYIRVSSSSPLRSLIEELNRRKLAVEAPKLRSLAYLADFPLLLQLQKEGLEIDTSLAIDIFLRSNQEDKFLFADHVLQQGPALNLDLVTHFFEYGGASLSLLARLLDKARRFPLPLPSPLF